MSMTQEHNALVATHTFISLCTGAGALDAGLRLALPGAQPVCYVEREATEAGVLATSIATGWVPDAPLWSDLLTFDAGAWRGLVDGVVGGFPCQPHSYAGKRLGEHDERNLWPDVARIVFESGASWCFFENVPGILGYYYREIRPVLQAMGFEVAEGIYSAEEVGAPHLRERLFWLAYRAGSAEQREQPQERPEVDGRGREPVADAIGSGHDGRAPEPERGQAGRATATRAGEGMGDAECDGRHGGTAGCSEPRRWSFPPGPGDADGWAAYLRERPGHEPALPKSEIRLGAHGLARFDWLHAGGNGVVPLTVAVAFRSLARKVGWLT